jgi:hypothetical protein
MERRFRLASLLAAALLFAGGPACMIANCTLAVAKPACHACHPDRGVSPDSPRPGADSLPCCVSIALPEAPRLASPGDAGSVAPRADACVSSVEPAFVLSALGALSSLSEHAPTSPALRGPSGERAPPLG